MSLRELNYSQGAQWVQARCTEKTTDSEVSTALQALAHAAARADADCAVEGLFPGSTLEVLLSRDLDSKDPNIPPLPVKVELTAMRAIGEAIMKEMQATATKLLTLRVDGCGEIVVFLPEMRETVLLGTRTTLLDA
ncbi:MAG: hypothetical protein WCY98_08720 [Castellaniella sp.]